MPSRALLAVSMLMLVAGCGAKTSAGSGTAGGSASEPATASGGKTVEVRMKDILFVPEKISARVGQTVVWTNEDDVAHTVKAKQGANFSSKPLSKGDTYKAKLTKAGTIAYACTIHPSQTGTITVTP